MTHCHHCQQPFVEDETRILADVIIPGAAGVEGVALHERCIADDSMMRYLWQNVRIERIHAASQA
jgi:hypothetical protein